MHDRQIQHEIDMSRCATNKIRNELRKVQDKNYASNTDFGRSFLKVFILPFSQSLVDNTGKTARGRATTTAIAGGYRIMQRVFSFVDPDLVSYISLKSLLDLFYTSPGNQPKTVEGSKVIGKRIRDELLVQYYTQLAPEGVVSALNKRLDQKGSTPSVKRKGARHVAEKLLKNVHGWSKEDLFQDFSNEEKFRAGLFVLDVAAKQGLIVSQRVWKAKNNSPVIYRLSREVEDQAQIYQTNLEDHSVLKWPLLAIPKEWKNHSGSSRNNWSGGYYSEWIRRDNSLCRSHNSDTNFGSDAINFLNTLGRTAWNIDSLICDLSTKCIEDGVSIASLNSVFHDPRLDEKMPQRLVDKDKDDDERKDWVKTKSLLHKDKQDALVKGRKSREATSLARQFQKEPRFYLSWSCDYRGRMYSQQTFLHQACTDFERSLVTFADGCKLDKEGESWAATALGAAFVGDKVPYAERAQWTYANKELIQAIVADPIPMSGHWDEHKADNPWQFLQLANEWNRVVLTKEKALWDVPISSDSTASGLQLLSGMRRDPKGMEFSNLLPPENPDAPPKDAYLEVLRIAKELVERDPEKKWMARYLDPRTFSAARKLAKPILMTALYGSSLQTNTNAVKDEFFKAGLFPGELNYQDVLEVSKQLRTASKHVFPMAFRALNWITKLFNQAKKNGNTSFTWTTPNLDSIHLIAEYYETKRIDSKFLGKTSIPLSEVKEPDFQSMKTALAPGFVHSYDAALLKSSFQDWHHPIAVIHDCLKVLPNDMDRAKERIRNGFVHVCSGDPLARLADDLGVSAEQLPRLEQGSGDLNSVLNSAYMFN